ncbi:Uncharacterized protein TCM_021195 [Theobroma cacao]|uniref:Uncharacterized protein n=1 Tax=Theobroma cacao TaxID=3641 RepID=A0A061EN68_THECC|nr:Uncharacterized protein TCM_021195 [Theobroma cacao]
MILIRFDSFRHGVLDSRQCPLRRTSVYITVNKIENINCELGCLADRVRPKKAPGLKVAHPGNRTPVSTVGGYYDTTTPDALVVGSTFS